MNTPAVGEVVWAYLNTDPGHPKQRRLVRALVTRRHEDQISVVAAVAPGHVVFRELLQHVEAPFAGYASSWWVECGRLDVLHPDFVAELKAAGTWPEGVAG